MLCSRYFVNDIDEIRNIANPDSYFKFFLNHNERINDCQRFAFDSEFPCHVTQTRSSEYTRQRQES